ncbi:MAG: GatB/YqeY domain-containing protein [Chloroflexi bacterium]|nr:MAG: GatB/YqeY domain-containing protein [Chloroflexota bacterium]
MRSATPADYALCDNPPVVLYERIEGDLVDARKRRDELALSTLGLLKSEVVKATKEPGASRDIDDQLVLRVVRKEVKRREEAAQAYADAGRAESADRENREAAILRAYLPAGLSAEQLEAEVRRVIEDVQPSGPGGFGQVMKEASRRLAGRAEGGEIAGVARRLLAEA